MEDRSRIHTDGFLAWVMVYLQKTTFPDGGKSTIGINLVGVYSNYYCTFIIPSIKTTTWWFHIFFIFTPINGEMIQFDEHVFQLGWNHHQNKQIKDRRAPTFGRCMWFRGWKKRLCDGPNVKHQTLWWELYNTFNLLRLIWYMDVSKNTGTPKWMVYNGKPY